MEEYAGKFGLHDNRTVSPAMNVTRMDVTRMEGREPMSNDEVDDLGTPHCASRQTIATDVQ